MPSTYTLNNGIELIATGEQSGTWGDTTNTNLSLVDTALDGQVTVTLPSAGTSGSPNTLAISDGAASDGRNRMVIFNDGGDLGATAYVQLTPNDAEKIIYVRNDLAGSRSIILFQGTYNASNDYELPAGTTAVIYFDGAGSGAVAANVFNNAYFDSLRLGSVSVTAILDEDNMGSDSATALATQQSIKAYVDSQVTAQDLDFAGDSGTGAVDLDSQSLTIAGTTNEIETSASGQTLTIGLPDDVTIAGDLTVDTDTLYVDSTNNRVGIGDATPSATLNVSNDSGGANTWTNAASGIIINETDASSPASIKFGPTTVSEGGQIVWGGAGGDGPFVLRNYNLVRLKIDADGRVLIGAEDSVPVSSGSGSGLQVSSTASQSWISQLRYNNGASGPLLNFGKTRSATIGTVGTIVADDDTIGTVNFAADDGVDVQTQAARIQANVDGTPGANDMPGRLSFWTTADGASSVTERMRIDSQGRVQINATVAGSSSNVGQLRVNLPANGHSSIDNMVYIQGASGTGLLFGNHLDGDGYGGDIVVRGYSSTHGDLRFTRYTGNYTDPIQSMTIDSDGRVLIGHTSSLDTAGISARLQLSGTNSSTSSSTFTRFSANNGAPSMRFGKSRAASSASNAIVQDGDYIGTVNFVADDGTDLYSTAAFISGQVDGTPGSNDMPGRLAFFTTPDGAVSSTERMRINSSGDVGINVTSDTTTALDVMNASADTNQRALNLRYNGGMSSGANEVQLTFSNANPNSFQLARIASSYEGGTYMGSLRFYTNSNTDGANLTEAMRIDQSQRVLIGTTSAYTSFFNNDVDPQFQVVGADSGASSVAVVRTSNDGDGPSYLFGRMRSTSHGIVQNGDRIGRLTYQAADGVALQQSASIDAYVDGTPGVNDTPARIVFSTTADGANTYTERMRISQNGFVNIGGQRTADECVIELNRSTSNTVGEGYIGFGGSSDPLWALRLDNSDANFMFDRAYGGWTSTPAMSIRRSNGYVGLGVNTASYQLDVQNSANTFSRILATGNNTRAAFLAQGHLSDGTDINMSIGVFGDANQGEISMATGHPLLLYTNNDPTKGVELQVDGDLNIKDGNLVVANGHGIDFSATSGTGTSELLDDYEEGTWTPAFKSDGGTTGTQTDTSVWAYYTRIGRQVTVHFNWSGSLSGYTGTLHIDGLPYNVGINYQFTGSLSADASTGSVSNGSNFMFFAYSNSLYPRYNTGTSSGYLYTGSYINGLTGFSGTATYIVST